MKYTVLGFSQNKAVENNLDMIDLTLLRYFIDFKDTGKMSTMVENAKIYYWFKYDGFIKEYPILSIKKDAIYRRMKILTEKDFLIHITVRKGGTYSYYNISKNIICLLSDTEPEGYGLETVGGTVLNPQGGTVLKPEQNNPSTKINPSTKYINIYTYWNSKNIINHKNLTKEIEKAINKSLKDYSEDEILKAIDAYKEILDSEFYFNYKWNLKDFLNRTNGISTFMEEGSNKVNYQDWRGIQNGANRNSNFGQDIKPNKKFNIKIENGNALTDEERARAEAELI